LVNDELKGCGRKWPHLRACLEGLEKTRKTSVMIAGVSTEI